MKFCPECGRPREDKDICDCGYNYVTAEVDQEVRSKHEEPHRQYADIMDHGFDQNPVYVAISLEELKKRKLDLGDLLSVSYTSSGGMMGSYYHEELSFEKNEFFYVNQDWHHGEKIKKVYKADPKDVKEIKSLYVENNIGAWKDLPIDRGMIAYDAPNSSYCFAFEKGNVSLSTNVLMSVQERDILSDINKKINSFKDDKNLISEETLEEGQPLGLGMTTTPSSSFMNIPNTNRFCPECGNLLGTNDKKCPTCGQEF